ncbi:MAG: dienelactone hydrolase family protein [Rubripirellula sp.]|jgi:predicted peptidase
MKNGFALGFMPLLLLFVNTVVAQSSKNAVGDRRGNLRLETVSIPEEISRGFVRLNSEVLLYHPMDTKGESSPLVIFLHGSGGARRSIERSKWSGEVKSFVSRQPGLPSVHVLVPQSNGVWDPGSLDKMLDCVLEENPSIDAKRVYCVGYSMGGKGTWEWGMTSPERFAAIIPKGFIPDLSKLEGMVQLPIWAMVGTKDSKPRSEGIPAMKKALENLGSTVVRTTVFEGANHATAAGKSKQQEGVYEWLFSHRLPRRNEPDASVN